MAVAAGTARTERVDVAVDGGRPEVGAAVSSVSRTGRFVAFSSSANDLVAGDTHETSYGRDVFVRDRRGGTTVRVSVASDGSQGDGESDEAAISASGRYVAFSSYASNFAAGDDNDNSDVFVHDRRTGRTELISRSRDGSVGNTYSGGVAISADARYVAFSSLATDLVATPVAGLHSRVYVRDRVHGRTELVSRDGVSTDRPAISADGRFVAFAEYRTPRRRAVVVVDRSQGRRERVDVSSRGRAAVGDSEDPSVSDSGRFVAFASTAGNLVTGDRNRGRDVFVRDRRRGTTTRVSVRPNGRPVARCPLPESDEEFERICAGEPSISGDGRFVAFISERWRFDDAGPRGGSFLRDRRTGTTVRVSYGPRGAPTAGRQPALSADGRFVVFHDSNALLIRGPLR